MEQPCYTLLHIPTETEHPSEMQLKEALEKGKSHPGPLQFIARVFLGDTKVKVETLKKLIYMVLGSEKVSQGLLMYVIRFCLPSQDHLIKKMLLVFWEVVPKTHEGKLLQVNLFPTT